MSRHKSTAQNAARFWSKVDRSGGPNACWPYLCFTDKDGYGDFWLAGRTEKAHRCAYFFEHGEWPEPNACHSCDTPACCNPAHIFPGTVADNMADRDAKGRHWVQHGEQHPVAKLTEAAVREIRALRDEQGLTLAELARKYDVGLETIFDVVHRRTWKHVA